MNACWATHASTARVSTASPATRAAATLASRATCVTSVSSTPMNTFTVSAVSYTHTHRSDVCFYLKMGLSTCAYGLEMF